MQDAPIYEPGHIVGGRYRIFAPLSRGGMGAVYLAQQTSLGREVALKVILDRGSDPELLKRFDIEARAVCQLRHPNTITYHDYGRDEDGHPYLVMEYLAGYPGSKLIAAEPPRSVEDLVHVVVQVCSALHEAHSRGIVHRDLKWSNVMVCPQSHDPLFAKLIDFGIMKVQPDAERGLDPLTRTGMMLGTPQYMSPEAICGLEVDGRADQYALAIMLWEAIEGERPFDGAPQFELLRRQVQEPPPPITRGRHHLSRFPGLEAVIEQGMEKHPSDRFASILEFRDALLRAMEGRSSQTIPARPRRSLATSTRALQGEREPPRSETEPPPSPPATSNRRIAGLVALFVVVAALSALVVSLVMPASQEKSAAQRSPEIALTQNEGLEFSREQLARDIALREVSQGDIPTARAAEEQDGLDASSTLARLDETPEAPHPKPGMPSPDATSTADTAASGPISAIADSASRVPEIDTAGGDVKADIQSNKHADHPRTGSSSQPGRSTEPASDSSRTDSAPSGEGTFTLITDPWAMVMIGERRVANASFFDLPVPAGTHRITVWNHGLFKDKYVFTVTIKAGKNLTRSLRLADVLTPVE